MGRQVFTDAEGLELKKDGAGRMYREIRCNECRAWLGDEFIREGRIILKCFRCGNISLMVFRPRRKGSSQQTKVTKDKES